MEKLEPKQLSEDQLKAIKKVENLLKNLENCPDDSEEIKEKIKELIEKNDLSKNGLNGWSDVIEAILKENEEKEAEISAF